MFCFFLEQHVSDFSRSIVDKLHLQGIALNQFNSLNNCSSVNRIFSSSFMNINCSEDERKINFLSYVIVPTFSIPIYLIIVKGSKL